VINQRRFPFKQCLPRIAALLLLLPILSQGQTAISAWTLGYSNPANNDTTAYSPTITFSNQINTITSINAGSGTGSLKTIASNASEVFVRRSGVTGASADNANVWEVATASNSLMGVNTATLGTGTLQDVLLNHNALMGVNDLFSNTGGTPAQVNNNIERVDYHWNTPFTAVPDQGFAVFDRAASTGVADGFQIAVITGWAANAPTAYGGNVVEVLAGTGKYGAALDWDPTNTAASQTTFGFEILRFDGAPGTGDSLATLNTTAYTAAGSGQSVFGTYISFADLGIPQGTVVYGYSIMGSDVTNTVANLVDWTNNTNYSQATPDTGAGNGSIDLLSVNGMRFVPEPSTYGAMFMGLGSLMLGFRRWRQAQRTVA
jgi:hypothetical protein